MEVKSYRDLIAWQKGMDFAVVVYEVTSKFPRSEQFGLTNQLRRASSSIPSNIAEGHSRRTTKDFLHFISISRGSMAEVETQLILGHRLKYVDKNILEHCLAKSAELGRIINGLASSLRKRLS